MENSKIRIDESILIEYIFGNFIITQQQLLSEFNYSYKVETNDEFILGILFKKEECKFFYYDVEENVLKNLLIKSYNDFISDTMINKFKSLNLPEYMLRLQRCNNDIVRDQLVDFFKLGKFEFRFNPYYEKVECYWKKANLSFLVNPDNNQLYEVISSM